MSKTLRIRLTEFTRNNHYDTVGRAIAYIREHARQQPNLGEIARHAGMSPQHLLETFHRWAGITPKQFLKILTLTHAKQLLLEDYSTLETSMECGLSSTGRLYDLFVTVEAVTPGEFKRLGKGLVLRWGIHTSPFGDCMIVASERGLTHLYFPGEETAVDLVAALERTWPFATIRKDDAFTAPSAAKVFYGRSQDDTLPLLLKGTPFQLKVWQALLEIPQGDTTAYSRLAQKIGRPAAHRACATAVGDNPISYLIPCHRVLRKSMELGGYRWGLDRKCAILATETAR